MLLKAVRLGEITKRVSIDGEENRPKPGPVVLHRGKKRTHQWRLRSNQGVRTETRSVWEPGIQGEKRMLGRREHSTGSNGADGSNRMRIKN